MEGTGWNKHTVTLFDAQGKEVEFEIVVYSVDDDAVYLDLNNEVVRLPGVFYSVKCLYLLKEF